MPDPRYTIDWQPPDLSPGLSFFAALRKQHHDEDRANEYVRMQREAMNKSSERESAALKRQLEQDKYHRAVEAYTAMPALQRAAMKSVGMANANPYGVKFEEEQETPSLRDSGINVMGGNDQYAQHAAKALLGQPSTPPEAPAIDPTVGQHSGAPSVSMGQHAPAIPDEAEMAHGPAEEMAEGPSPGIQQAEAVLSQPHQKRLYANYQGQRFEVPPQSDHTPFGADYDSVYQGLIEAGEDPHKAMQFVAAQYKADQTQENIAKRTAENTAALIHGRDTSREDQQTFQSQQDAQYRRTFEQSLRLAQAAAARRDPTGGADPAIMAALADYATKNPGDVGGLYREADALHAPSAGKAVTTITGATKPTESQTKDAKQAAIGLRAVSAIEQSGFVPDKGTIQKWLNNQREVYQAQKAGEGGGIGGLIGGFVAGKAQKHGVMAQSEVEGLPPDAQNYFANVRRFMETIGRAQSGAAISPTEWQNFFNQYGPTSPGGIGAARQYLEDQLKVSGVAGRSLGSNTGRKGPSGNPSEAHPDRKLRNGGLARWNAARGGYEAVD